MIAVIADTARHREDEDPIAPKAARTDRDDRKRRFQRSELRCMRLRGFRQRVERLVALEAAGRLEE